MPWSFLPWFCRITEAKQCGRLWSDFKEALRSQNVRVRPKLQWNLRIGGGGTMDSGWKKLEAQNGAGQQRLCVHKQQRQKGYVPNPWESPGTWHGAVGFGVCPDGFQSCFGLIISYYVPIPPFWKWNIYFVALYNFFASISKLSQKTLWTFEMLDMLSLWGLCDWNGCILHYVMAMGLWGTGIEHWGLNVKCPP